MVRSAARSARKPGDREKATRSSSPASGSASTATAMETATVVNTRAVSVIRSRVSGFTIATAISSCPPSNTATAKIR